MARATFELPSVLASVIGGVQRLQVEGETLRAALEHAFEQQPALRVHLFDESGELRRHVLCFLNQSNSRWLDSLDEKLTKGDRITILQAVSGG